MKRLTAAILCALSLSVINLGPVLADEPSTGKSDSSAAGSTESKESGKEKKKVKAKKTSSPAPTSTGSGLGGKIGGVWEKVPHNVPAFLAGVVVGTPIAFVRMSKREIKTATTDLVGETDNPIKLGAGGVLGVPAGLMSGAIYGLFAGVADSWKNADDNPYSKDSFSLGDMK